MYITPPPISGIAEGVRLHCIRHMGMDLISTASSLQVERHLGEARGGSIFLPFIMIISQEFLSLIIMNIR